MMDSDTSTAKTETKQSFSNEARPADQWDSAVAMSKDDQPSLAVPLAGGGHVEYASKVAVLTSAAKIMEAYDAAFRDLAAGTTER